MHKNRYLIVTNDEYELPVAELIGIRACCEFTGLSETTVYKHMSDDQWSKYCKYKVILLGKYNRFDKKKYDRKYYKEYIKTHDRSEYFKKRWREKHG